MDAAGCLRAALPPTALKMQVVQETFHSLLSTGKQSGAKGDASAETPLPVLGSPLRLSPRLGCAMRASSSQPSGSSLMEHAEGEYTGDGKFHPWGVWGITSSGRLGPSRRKVTRKVQCVRYFGREKKAAKYCMLVKNGRVFKEDLIRAWKHNQHLKYTANLSY